MSRPPGPGKCVHCLKDVETRNWDHVLPVSWYPDSTPVNMEKWKVPTCTDCNREYGKLEKRLLGKIGLCLDASDPEISSIVDKALKSIDPEQAASRRDKRARQRERDKILEQMDAVKGVSPEHAYPNFGPREGQGEYVALPIGRHEIDAIAEKIAKGVLYKEQGLFLDDGYSLEVYVVRDEDASGFMEIVAKYGEELNRGAGLSVVRATLPEDGRTGLYAITVWKQLKFYVVIGPHNLEELAEMASKAKQKGTH